MARVLFKEIQSMREYKMIWWIITPVSAAVIISLLYGLYWQLVMGEPWGTEPMSDTGLMILSMVSFIILGIVIWILLSVKLEIEVDGEAIRYRYYPQMRKRRELRQADIQEYTVRKLSFLESRRRGYRRSISGRQQRLIVYGRHALVLTLKNGKKITMGTQKPRDLEAALKSMMSKAELD
jgi:hypothetical protein